MAMPIVVPLAPLFSLGDIVCDVGKPKVVVGFLPHPSGLSDDVFLFNPEQSDKLECRDAIYLERANVDQITKECQLISKALALESKFTAAAVQQQDPSQIYALAK